MAIPSYTYEQIAGELQTGDLLFCHGIVTGSERIEKLEDCEWSHVAMVVRLDAEEILIWESTSADNLQDVRFHDTAPGPQLVRLIDRISTDVSNDTDTLFGIRKLQVERTPAMLEAMNAFFREVYEAEFPGTARMYAEVLAGKVGIKTSYKDFFCSKLLAATYIQMGLLSEDRPPNDYEPKDFTPAGSVKLISGASLGECCFIKP
ncbi:hypothetical protein B5M42_016855 [Paenibacillus athensensis]|uniref:Permuted papain-like amidase enzyme, YaeF/YiiX, C92 family n=1 Tax=Paenibacillus athensensis TaxID=1967502 RepID=A0A4Y8PSH0_9BACL|nr:hypothetical protein [Paenibacillus athensensis]MCD1260472.1 hypothetical protein [Paenibacillus athensensis]